MTKVEFRGDVVVEMSDVLEALSDVELADLLDAIGKEAVMEYFNLKENDE